MEAKGCERRPRTLDWPFESTSDRAFSILMQLHCLGTAGYHPNEHRHTSCYFLPESGIVLDAGTGLFRLAGLIQTSTLDILLSHAHLDHVAGLTFLLDVLFRRPVDEVRIWGQQANFKLCESIFFPSSFFRCRWTCSGARSTTTIRFG